MEIKQVYAQSNPTKIESWTFRLSSQLDKNTAVFLLQFKFTQLEIMNFSKKSEHVSVIEFVSEFWKLTKIAL